MASLNLLVGYGSDSESSESDTEPNASSTATEKGHTGGKNFFETNDSSSSEEEPGDQDEHPTTPRCANLQNPFLMPENVPQGQSVFANPFKAAEDAEKDKLEKHQKFAPKLEDIKEINGRKICWQYRKGRCRFGSKCVFAHDCELLQKQAPPPDPSEYVISSPDFSEAPSGTAHQFAAGAATSSKNKRPGLSQGIIPGKKVMKKFHQQQAAEQPWVAKKT